MRTCILGAGNWGTTLAVVLARAGHEITLWVRDPGAASEIRQTRENRIYLPGVKLPEQIAVVDGLCAALSSAEVCFLALPVQQVRSVLKLEHELLREKTIVNLAKGLEQHSRLRISEICQQEIPEFRSERYVVLSGPTIAPEIAGGLPASAVVASVSEKTATAIQEAFSNPLLRLYTSDDVCGVEVGGAIKNIIAIAAGICDGLGLGMNAKGALLSRGLAEMTRLADCLNANRKTLFGLAGMGDLVTTCFSPHSRNRRLGESIGEGCTLKESLEKTVMVVEGVWTAGAALELAHEFRIDLPITQAVGEILLNNKPAKHAVHELMTRRLKPED